MASPQVKVPFYLSKQFPACVPSIRQFTFRNSFLLSALFFFYFMVWMINYGNLGCLVLLGMVFSGKTGTIEA